MNIVRVTPLFGAKMQSQNEFHYSLFARNLHWTRLTLNPCKSTTWTWINQTATKMIFFFLS